ncbi:Protein of unknown function [Pyronema omphalodes CBS 100304]|uniref:Uncharacterized protein n=1 Tax=Pyronema omphalodes (strain CBS 100304) TaxID=1076935 RepID=U4LK14_PYROM|nr:Protein of unknown function [Pyronema omphalodes CBS 100304]
MAGVNGASMGRRGRVRRRARGGGTDGLGWREPESCNGREG